MGLYAATVSVPEGVSGFSWTGLSFPGSGALSLALLSALPPGFALVLAGRSLHLFGSLAAGLDGSWPVALSVMDSVLGPTYLNLLLDIVPAWKANEDEVDPDSDALGEFYYALTGGPLRQEFQWPAT